MKLFHLDGKSALAARQVGFELNFKCRIIDTHFMLNVVNCVSALFFFLVCSLLSLCELRRLEMPYYLNMYTKESQWELPTEAAEEGVSNGPSQVQAAHLLVKHKDSRRASSWREENITRTKDEAHEILSGYLDKVSNFFWRKSSP